MGIYEEIEKKNNEQPYVKATITDFKEGKGLDVKIAGVSIKELKYIMVSLSERICENENTNFVELYAELAMIGMLRKGKK